MSQRDPFGVFADQDRYNMKYLIYTLTIIILLAINVGFFSTINLMPNLLLIFLIFHSLDKENNDFFFIALASGLLLDFYSATFTGTFMLSFLIVGLILHLLATNVIVLEINWKIMAVLSAATLALTDVLVWFFSWSAFKLGWAKYLIDISMLRHRFLVDLVCNLLLLYPMYLLAGFIKSVVENFQLRQRNKI